MQLALAALLLSGLRLDAATYYVSPSGSDSNAGTQAQPWRTIQRAANTMIAGDSAVVQAGTYGEIVSSVNSGSSGAPITYQANGTVTVNGFRLSDPYITVEGFTLTGTGVSGYQGAIYFASGADNVLVRDCTVDGTPANVYGLCHTSSGIQNMRLERVRFLDTGFHSMNLYGSGHAVEQCWFENRGGWDAIRMFASNTRIAGCTFTNWSNTVGNNNHTDIIQTFSVQNQISTNVVFERNLVINSDTQIGMMEDQARTGRIGWWTFRNNVYDNVSNAIHIYVHDVYWYNNTFYRCGRNTGGPVNFRFSTEKGTGANGRCYNNVFLECGVDPARPTVGWYGIDSGVTGVLADYNFVAGSNGAAKTGFNETHGINGGDIRLASIPLHNFRLTSASPAIDAGVSLSGFGDDFAGVARPRGSGWDLGAYEYQTAGTSPQAPRNLHTVP